MCNSSWEECRTIRTLDDSDLSKWSIRTQFGPQLWSIRTFDDSDLRPKKIICVFQVSRSYLGFCPDSKHFIVNCEQNVVNFGEKWGKMYWKMQFLYKIFRQNRMLIRPTIPCFFRAETWNTHIFFFGLSQFGPWPLANLDLIKTRSELAKVQMKIRSELDKVKMKIRSE